jgi:ABC-2 type transport system permease protein
VGAAFIGGNFLAGEQMMTNSIAYSISILAIILLPVFFAILLRRYFRVPWFLFCVGILTFIGSQVVHLPLNAGLTRLGILPRSTGAGDIPLWQTVLVLGLTAGICEELARTAGYALVRKYRRLEHGIMFGLGHGGIEAMVFGGVLTAAAITSLTALKGIDLAALQLSTEQLSALNKQMALFSGSAWSAALPFVERLLALSAQVLLSLIVLQAFRRKNGLFVLAAILYHALIDASLVYLAEQVSNPWIVYGAFIILLIPGAAWAWYLWSRPGLRPVERVPTAKASTSADWRAFLSALRKEMLYQSRSKRLLVVFGVFTLFGLMSPLLAYFTPEIIKSLPGAEQIAGLIPIPTAVDAMTQYVKNLTQFGFILAVLLGMGAVVGEKEHGTIAMILSKPLPRWAFVISKFTAQVAVYLAAFTLAMIGTYYYTVVLFGSFDVLVLATISAILFIWLLTFASVTLLASVLARSTGAAAGIGLGFSIVLLLSSYLPKVGPLTPGGLVTWANQLGSGIGSAGNGGAVALAVVIILVSLLTSVALFELQDLE